MNPMEKAWEILKMSKPYRGPDIRNETQYEAASLEGRMLWHQQQYNAYNNRLRALRTQHSVDLTDVENPVYQEMKHYQDIRAFHGRQAHRLKKCIALGNTECNDYYSLELEGSNRKKIKYQTTPAGQLDPYVELPLETYNNLTHEQKAKYHMGMERRGIDKEFHSRMYSRLSKKYQLPTFPSPKYGGESAFGVEYTKEEYLSMDNKSKEKYHGNMAQRFKKKNIELAKFHWRMNDRLRKNRPLPTYFSPEDEQEEE